MKKRAVFIWSIMLVVCAVGLCACRKEDKSTGTENEWWVRGHFLTGLSQPMLVTVPDTTYSDGAPIVLTPMEGVDLSQYVDGDVIEIDSDIMDMLAEHGWIELKTETITD